MFGNESQFEFGFLVIWLVSHVSRFSWQFNLLLLSRSLCLSKVSGNVIQSFSFIETIIHFPYLLDNIFLHFQNLLIRSFSFDSLLLLFLVIDYRMRSGMRIFSFLILEFQTTYFWLRDFGSYVEC